MPLIRKVVFSNVCVSLRVFSAITLILSLLLSCLAFPEDAVAMVRETVRKAQRNSSGGSGSLLSIANIANAKNYHSLLGALFSPDTKRDKAKSPDFNRVEILPGERTVLQGETLDYTATAFRGEQSVAGIVFQWTVLRVGLAQTPRGMLNGRFEAQIPGQYIVTALANGLRAARGGFPIIRNGQRIGTTSPFGHWQKLKQYQNGLRNAADNYDRNCNDRNDGRGGRGGGLPQQVRSLSKQHIPRLAGPNLFQDLGMKPEDAAAAAAKAAAVYLVLRTILRFAYPPSNLVPVP